MANRFGYSRMIRIILSCVVIILFWAVFFLTVILLREEKTASVPGSGTALSPVRERRETSFGRAWQRASLAASRRVKQFEAVRGQQCYVAVRDLRRGLAFRYRAARPVFAASVIKVPVMAACFLQLQRRPNTAANNTLSDIKRMVADSDNDALNRLRRRLGYDGLHRWFRRMGLGKTRLRRGTNVSTAADIMTVLRNIYYGRMVSPTYSRYAVEYLAAQKYRDRLPSALPGDVKTANKTGTFYRVSRGTRVEVFCHDIGLVFTGKGDFAAVFFSRVEDTVPGRRHPEFVKAFYYKGTALITDITRMFYRAYDHQTEP